MKTYLRSDQNSEEYLAARNHFYTEFEENQHPHVCGACGISCPDKGTIIEVLEEVQPYPGHGYGAIHTPLPTGLYKPTYFKDDSTCHFVFLQPINRETLQPEGERIVIVHGVLSIDMLVRYTLDWRATRRFQPQTTRG